MLASEKAKSHQSELRESRRVDGGGGLKMALFLFGAGATRGASFVNPADNPCLPPLDFDFYAQLQRIANLKHKQTVRDVIKDTVDLFGINFQVTMES